MGSERLIISDEINDIPRGSYEDIDYEIDMKSLWMAFLVQMVNDALIPDKACVRSGETSLVRASARAFWDAPIGEMAEHRELVLSFVGFDPVNSTKYFRGLIEKGVTPSGALTIRAESEKALKSRIKKRTKEN